MKTNAYTCDVAPALRLHFATLKNAIPLGELEAEVIREAFMVA
jgi:hypothetical protein